MLKIVAAIVVSLAGDPVFQTTIDRDAERYATAEACEMARSSLAESDEQTLRELLRPRVDATFGEDAGLDIQIRCVADEGNPA